MTVRIIEIDRSEVLPILYGSHLHTRIAQAISPVLLSLVGRHVECKVMRESRTQLAMHGTMPHGKVSHTEIGDDSARTTAIYPPIPVRHRRVVIVDRFADERHAKDVCIKVVRGL